MRWKPRGWTLICLLLAMPGVIAMRLDMAMAQVSGAVATTQVSDTVFRADGTAATGTVIISWNAFTTPTGLTVASGTTSATIATGGALSVQLAPNAGATPIGSYYTAVYHLDDGTVSREFWVVPVSQSAVTLSAVRSTVLPTSVAMQTVSKSYVDTAIAAAVTGHPLDSSTPYVLKAGDTMTGPLVLPGDPTAATQAADKHYVDVNVASSTAGLAQKVSTVPAGGQVVTQPTGTQLQVNLLNGSEYASQYVNGTGNNGVANAVTSPDCATGCNLAVDRSYISGEVYHPQSLNSSATGGTYVEDTRNGERRDSYLNPMNGIDLGQDAGQVVDVVSTRNTVSEFQQNGAPNIGSYGLLITQEGLTGGSNQYPADIEGTAPYFKTGYSALSVNGTYNTLGQHVLAPHTLNCYGVGDCLIGSQFIYASGGFRDNADEGTHPFDLQIQEDSRVFQGTCSSGCSAGSTSVTIRPTSAPGTQGEGRYLIDKNPANILTAGSLTGATSGVPGAGATFSGTSFPVSVFLATTQIAPSQATALSPGTVTLGVATSGVPTGFATNTAALPATSGVACVVDRPNGYNPQNYEMANYHVVDGTHLQLTLNKVHAANATIAVGGLCGYGLEQTVDTAQGIRQVFPVTGSFSATGLYYAGGTTPIVGAMAQTSGFANVNLQVAAIARNSNVVTVTTAGNLPVDVNGLTMTVAGVADSSYNGSYAVTTTGPNTLTYVENGANSTSTGGSVSLLTGGYALYPMAEVLGVFNATTKSVDGQMTLAPNGVEWAANDVVEEPHYFQELVTADVEYVGQTTPRPTVIERAGIQYQSTMGPGMRGWSITNAVPATNYFANGGTHTPPDTAYEAQGVWMKTLNAQAGEQSVFSIHCNSRGCGRWNSSYNLFELDSNVGVDTVAFQPLTSSLGMSLRGTAYSFTPQGFTAGTINATTLNATTLNATTINAGTVTGTIAAAQLPVFGASGPGHAVGAVPDPGATAGTTRYLREDGSWSTPTGSGSGGGSGSSTMAAGLVTNGLLASYPLTDGSGTAPRDESGNGNAAAFCSGSQTPVWTGQGLLLNAAVSACFTVPASIGYTNVRTIEITYTTKAPYPASGEPLSGPYPCWICSSASGGLEMMSVVANGAQPILYDGGSSPNATGVGSHTMVITFDPTNGDHWYIDGRETGYAQQGNSLGTITSAANNPLWVVGGSPVFPDAFQGTFHYVRFLNRALSVSEVAQDSATMQTLVSQRGVKFGAQTTPNDANVWVAHGDSRTAGAGSGIPYTTYLNTYSNATYQTQTLGIVGWPASALHRLTPTYDCYLASPTSAQTIASIWEGTNDINNGNGSNAATVWGSVANDARTFHNCGFTTIVANDPSRISDDAAEQVYDAYWRGLWQPYADGFVDFGADPLIGGTNAYLNTTYYAGDGVHYTVAGYTLIAQKFAREANYLKGSNLQNCTKVVSSAYTLVDADGCTKFSPSSGSFTATLYDANDFTGRTVYVQNAATSGANVLTIAAASGQTIDGAASITIPNGTMRVLQVVYNGTPGGGDSWHVLQ